MEFYLKTYTEPVPNSNGFNLTASTSTSSVPSTSTTSNFVSTSLVTNATSVSDQVTLPLPSGCLTSNYGIPITVVCCKVKYKTNKQASTICSTIRSSPNGMYCCRATISQNWSKPTIIKMISSTLSNRRFAVFA